MEVVAASPLTDVTTRDVNSPRLPRNSSAGKLAPDPDYHAALASTAADAKIDPLLLLASSATLREETIRARHAKRAVEARTSGGLLQLAAFFKHCPNPGSRQLNELAARLGMTEVELDVWFNNRRVLENMVRVHGLTPSDVAEYLRRSRQGA